MKKLGYLAIGIVIGSIMSFSVGAAADSISLIGKKISGESDVVVNGLKIGTAIIVNGSSYAPVRTIGDAAGFDVGFVNKKVILETPKVKEDEQVTSPSETRTKIDEINKRGQEIDSRAKDIIATLGFQDKTLTDKEKADLNAELTFLKEEAERLKQILETLK